MVDKLIKGYIDDDGDAAYEGIKLANKYKIRYIKGIKQTEVILDAFQIITGHERVADQIKDFGKTEYDYRKQTIQPIVELWFYRQTKTKPRSDLKDYFGGYDKMEEYKKMLDRNNGEVMTDILGSELYFYLTMHNPIIGNTLVILDADPGAFPKDFMDGAEYGKIGEEFQKTCDDAGLTPQQMFDSGGGYIYQVKQEDF